MPDAKPQVPALVVDVTQPAAMRAAIGALTSPALKVAVIGPPVTAQAVTYQGEVVTHMGEPVYVFVED